MREDRGGGAGSRGCISHEWTDRVDKSSSGAKNRENVGSSGGDRGSWSRD